MQLGGGGHRPRLADAAVAHAEVARLDDHRHAVGAQRGVDRVGDLGCELLLDLQALGVDVDDARELGEPDHAAVGDVRDMRLAHERHHVVLAVAVDLDVLEEHQLVVALDLAEGALQRLEGIGVVAPEVLVHGLDDPGWGVDQAFPRGVVADEAEERLHVRHGLLGLGGIHVGFEHGGEMVAVCLRRRRMPRKAAN